MAEMNAMNANKFRLWANGVRTRRSPLRERRTRALFTHDFESGKEKAEKKPLVSFCSVSRERERDPNSHLIRRKGESEALFFFTSRAKFSSDRLKSNFFLFLSLSHTHVLHVSKLVVSCEELEKGKRSRCR